MPDQCDPGSEASPAAAGGSEAAASSGSEAPGAGLTHLPNGFDYDTAFDRNIGWVSAWEQQLLRGKRVAIAGMGGVGGIHLLTLARLGIGAFHLADFDRFELVNFNRQIGATMRTLDLPKAEVIAGMARDINPELDLTAFPNGVHDADVDDFLRGVDLFVDGLDFFVLDIRRKIFARCAELGIPAITAAPLGFSTAYLVFVPGGMTFEQYFRLEGLPAERQYVNFFMGLAPQPLHRGYLVDPDRLNLNAQRGPSSFTGCALCAGVAGVEAVKLLLGRGPVRPAPWYHQFDAFEQRHVRKRLIGGNANPLQRIKLRAGYRHFAALARAASPADADVAATGSVVERILDLARWAPSGDNEQPWRFTVTGPDAVSVHIARPDPANVYEYAEGQPTILSGGMLLETLRIAASRFGRAMTWAHGGQDDAAHVIDVTFREDPQVASDPLLPFVTLRSVDRHPYRTTPLSPAQIAALEAALGDTLAVTWFHAPEQRKRLARINGMATDIRLRIPEAYAVHRRIVDWQRTRSPTGIPAGSLGLDRMTLALMRWALKDWRRIARMNRLPAATLQARQQMDYRPGAAAAAHFAISRKPGEPPPGGTVPGLLAAGMAIQRFWLTATRLGLALHPATATLCFAHYGRHGIRFTEDPARDAEAKRLAEELDRMLPDGADNVVFFGRIGAPGQRATRIRSIRRPLHSLILEARAKGLEGAASE
ncbi:MAG: thiamine biosynthesis protein ThiF [Rhodospirillales bacterium]|nr:MAG: thiamine biosynthesis protein ThiF [Rhodospirillales bacterium]